MGAADFNVRQPSVNVHRFAMIPHAEIPRSQFVMEHTHKTTLDASYLVPVFLQEVLPGDSMSCSMTAFTRMSTPIFPIMDNMRLESFFFFVPNRLVWRHWTKFMGEQDNPGDSISFSIPQIVSPANGFQQGSLADYFGLPCAGQVGVGNTISVSSLPFRAYALIYHQWFRDENLINATWVVGSTSGGVSVPTDDDGPDAWTQYTQFGSNGVMLRSKRHDYFTGCLPWTQKGGIQVSIPLVGNAVVKTSGSTQYSNASVAPAPLVWGIAAQGTSFPPTASYVGTSTTPGQANYATNSGFTVGASIYPNNLYADLSTATATTINALRLSFQTQKLLERDARGGTRYTEIVRSHFGVMSPDSRLQRAEYLGGGSSPVNITPVPQTTATGLSGGTTPLGTLGAVGTNVARAHGFRQSFTEHGHIIGLVCITGDLTYQQGVRKLWSRSTRYDFYFPVFANLGEQAVLNKEIYADGSANDSAVFGYQERWAEYRYFPSQITATFRSTASQPLDGWHLAQRFSSVPLLNQAFIQDPLSNVLDRNLALGATARTSNEQFLCDFFFSMKCARPMPLYSVPGLIDHF